MMKTFLSIATGTLFLVSTFATANAAVATFSKDNDGDFALITMADSTQASDVMGNDAFVVYQAMNVPVFDGLDGIQVKQIKSDSGKYTLDCRLDGDATNAYCSFYLKASDKVSFDTTVDHEKIHFVLPANADTDGAISGFNSSFSFLSHDHATTVNVDANSLVIDYNADNRCEAGICIPTTQPTPANQN